MEDLAEPTVIPTPPPLPPLSPTSSKVYVNDQEIFYLHAAWSLLKGPASVAHNGLGRRLERLRRRCYENSNHWLVLTHEEALLLHTLIEDRGVTRLARIVYPPKNGARSFTFKPQKRYLGYLSKKLELLVHATRPFGEVEQELDQAYLDSL